MAIEQPVTLRIDGLAGAFARVSPQARSEGELFERCRHTAGSVEVVIDAALDTAKRNGGAMVVTAGED